MKKKYAFYVFEKVKPSLNSDLLKLEEIDFSLQTSSLTLNKN